MKSKVIKNFSLVVLLLSVFSIIITGCSESTSTENSAVENEKFTVAVSIVPQKTFVEAVAGDLVNVVTMIPPGYSPANYAPSPKEMQGLSEAALYFSIGVPTEKANILPKLSSINPEIEVVDLASQVGQVYPHRYFDEDDETAHDHGEIADHDHHHEDMAEDGHEHDHENMEEHSHDHDHTGADPHIWLSPKRVQVMIDITAEELSKLDPSHKDIYQENALNYKNELTKLDQKLTELFKEKTMKTFFIYHPSLGYFADDYGLEMVAIEQDGKEATIEHLQEIIDLAKEKNIKVIFYQEDTYSKQADLIAQEIGGKTIKITPLAANYIENLENLATEFSKYLDS